MFLRVLHVVTVSCAVLGISLVGTSRAVGQVGGGGGGGGGQNTTTTTVNTSQIAGVMIDGDGVLRMHLVTDRGFLLSARRVAEARSKLDADIVRVSEMRKVSLNRLEAAVRDWMAGGKDVAKSLPEEMRYLAGLTRIQYVFFYPETNDIVIAGPAEGWAEDPAGRVRGFETGRPVIELADLIVALRAFPPQGGETPVVSCSIDPTQEGLANMQAFLREIPKQISGPPNAALGRFIADGLRRNLGLQIVSITGIPDDTHFAQILVEADYRMKLIGIGLERTAVKNLKSYVELASPSSVSANAMQRWYFVPNYECVRESEDRLAMELVGEGVKLVGADELVAADGTRAAAARVDMAGKRFVEGFTENFPDLAKVVPVYAQLRNCVDLVVAAAYIQKQDYYGQAGWSMELFGNEAEFPVQNVNAPKRVESAVASYLKGNRLMTPIGGGVRIEARMAFYPEHKLSDDDGKVKATRGEITLDHLQPGQWWWD